MDTKKVQLIGHPKDRHLVDVTPFEMRVTKTIYVPYHPADETFAGDTAYAEYTRFIAGTSRGQLMLWINPSIPGQALQKVVEDLVEGERTGEGIWVIQGAGIDGQLQILPLTST
jgi:hypothetical protein